MATANEATASSGEEDTPLLEVDDGAVDYHGRPVNRSTSGGWISAKFILSCEIAERFVYTGISSNLISYLIGPLGQSTATAAANVNAWQGAANLLPLLGAFIADSYLGQFRSIVISSLLYILGLGLLTLSAVLPSSTSSDCEKANSISPCSPPRLQVILFFFAIYLVAFAEGGHKPCVQAFGAGQFDEDKPEERKAKSSFFNWWYFGVCASCTTTLIVLTYIQDNFNWGLGFGIPCIVMGISLVIFLLGTTTYRFNNKHNEKSAFVRIGLVFVESAKNWRANPSAILEEEGACGTFSQHGSQQFKFLNKALLSRNGSIEGGKVCSMTEVEEAKSLNRLVPIWATCLVYGIVFAQSPTLCTKQGITMDRSIGKTFEIPSASLQFIITLTIVILIPIYDRVLVPSARAITGKPSGITMLQRKGIGSFVADLTMVIAALVEMKRLKTAREYGLTDNPGATIPMTIWWLVPQYLLFGIGDLFAVIGMQEFFYDQMPSDLKSIGLALYLSVLGIGSLLSGFLISVIEKSTTGADSWFSSNLNRAHLDYFYWLLAGIVSVALVAYLYFTRSYVYNRRSDI